MSDYESGSFRSLSDVLAVRVTFCIVVCVAGDLRAQRMLDFFQGV